MAATATSLILTWQAIALPSARDSAPDAHPFLRVLPPGPTQTTPWTWPTRLVLRPCAPAAAKPGRGSDARYDSSAHISPRRLIFSTLPVRGPAGAKFARPPAPSRTSTDRASLPPGPLPP